MKTLRLKTGFFILILLGCFFPLAGGIGLHLLLPHLRRVDVPVHAVIETLGCFAALFLAAIILLRQKEDKAFDHHVWMAGALISLGILGGPEITAKTKKNS